MSQTSIILPQFSTRTLSYLVAGTTGGATYVNASNITNDSVFGTLFTATASRVFLTTARPPIATANTRFLLTDSFGSNSFVNLNVTPPSFDVSAQINVLVQSLSRNLPIVLIPPSNVSGRIDSTMTGVPDTQTIACEIGGSNFSSNGYFVPTLTPLGLTSSTNTITGVVSITGIPTRPRPASNYSYYVFDGSRNQMRTIFSIQVQPPSFVYSTVSGVSIVGCNAAVVLNYNSANDIRISVDPPPQSFTLAGSFPIGASLVGSTLQLSGVPTSFIDTSAGIKGTFKPTYGTTTTPPLNLTFTMNPALVFSPDLSPTLFYQNVPYTSSAPIVGYSAQYLPSFPTPNYTWTVSSSIPGLDYTATGPSIVLYGTVGTLCNVADLTVSSGGLSATARLTLSAIPDFVTLTGPAVYTVSQNVAIRDLYVSATAASSSRVPQSFTYSATPPVSTIRGLAFLSNGYVTGTPLDPVACNIQFKAVNPQSVSATLDMSLIVVPDAITILPTGLAAYSNVSRALQVIQGRNIQLEHLDSDLTFQAVASSGNPVSQFPLAGGTPGAGLVYSSAGRVSGTPTFAGITSFTISATVPQANTFTGATVYIQSISDQFIRSSPASLDFVIPYGSTSNAQLAGILFSGLSVSDFTVSAPGVAVSHNGLLTLSGTTYSSASPFTIGVRTTLGSTVSLVATLTVNDPTLGAFTSPATPATIVFSNVGDTFPIQSVPGFTYTLSGGSGFSIVGTNIVRTSLSELYTPVLGVIQGPSNVSMPVRLATRTLEIDPLPALNWIEYASAGPYAITTSNWPIPTVVAMPDIPPGMIWDPITSVLEGSPRGLTVQDSFTVYATDGSVATSRTFPYSVRTPAFLRGFSSSSGFTNYTRQLAVVNGATHAIGKTALLPDPLIASQTGDYPPDVVKDVICEK